MAQIYPEITPLSPYDCFTVFNRKKTTFNFPIHYHDELEINLILNGKGVKRLIGDHQKVIDNVELVLVGSNLPHGWLTNDFNVSDQNKKLEEVTIQFHSNFLDENFLRRNQLYFIRELIKKSEKGISFSQETALKLTPAIQELVDKKGFASILALLSILHELSISDGMELLSGEAFSNGKMVHNSRRIQLVFDYMNENFQKEVTLSNVATIAGMTDASFSRFIKKRTGKTFIDSLNEIRLGHASKKLIDTTQTVSEIAYQSGFNNLSYFNRVFKTKKNSTPKQFRADFAGVRRFV